jgi:hypothetical protein
MDNWQEWVCGTEPLDALSVLKLLSPLTNGLGTYLSWLSVSNRAYFVERASTLNSSAAFSRIVTNIFGQPGVTSYLDTNAHGLETFFYRVGVH